MTPFAKEYGEALYMLATEEKIAQRIHDETQLFASLLEQEPKFANLLESHSISKEERASVLNEVAGSWMHPYLINFIKILCTRHAMHMFVECAQYYHKRYDAEFGIVEAVVATAVPLSRESAQAIQKMLEAKTNREIRLIEEVDPELLGGVRVDINGKRMDNTVKTRLDAMRRYLHAEA